MKLLDILSALKTGPKQCFKTTMISLSKVTTVKLQIHYFFSLVSRNSSATVRSDDSASSDAAERLREALTAFDEKLRRQRPSVDKALLKSAYHQSLLRVSWNLIEAEILHTPGSPFLIQSNCVDNFQ